MSPIVGKLDHLMIVSPDPKALFDLFTGAFGLPEAWDFCDYGNFASGGVFAGNTNLEFLGSRAFPSPGSARVAGLAFSPHASLDESCRDLEAAGIGAGPKKPFFVAGDRLLWTNLPVPGLLEEAPGVFLCAYAIDVKPRYEENARCLAGLGGGPLTLRGLETVTVETDDHLPWSRFLHSLAEAPAIALVPGRARRVTELRFTVDSLPAALQVWNGESARLQGLPIRLS